MAVDPATVMETMPTIVPMVGTLGLEFLKLDEHTAVLRMADQQPYHNHIGGPHAGAMFALGESASGALVMTNFGDQMGRATPLAVEATIRYLKVAMGPVTATARMTRTAADVMAELEAGSRPDFAVDIEIADETGRQTGAMTVVWTLRPNR